MIQAADHSEPSPTDIVKTCAYFFRDHEDLRILSAYVYGSVLGKRHRPDSDVDIAILDRDDAPLDRSEQAEIMDALERAIRWPVDLRMLREGSPSYQAHVLKTGRQVLELDPQAAREFASRVFSASQAQAQHIEADWAKLLQSLAGKAAR